MNFEYFIAKRIIDSKAYKSSISAPIIKIGIAAIAIGIIVMMIAIATGIGLQHKIRDKVVAFNGHVTITNYDNNNSQESENPISTNQEFYPNFTSVSGVRHIQGVATKGTVIRLEDNVEYLVIKGVGADYDWQFFKEYLIEGRLPDFTKKRNEDLLISKYFANRLKIKVGDKIQANFIKENLNQPPRIMQYNIVGIYDSGFKEYDQLYAIGDIKHIQRLNKWDDNQVGNFEVFIEDFNTLDQTGQAIRHEIPSILDSKTITQRFPTIFEWISIFVNNIFGIIGIMILVAGINMITALLVLILERTRMIGIIKSLGGSNLSIRKIFIYNATYLIVLGLFWGNLIGLGLLLAQKYFQFIKFPNPENYYMTYVPVYLDISYILALNIGTFILCLVMLLLPSYIITKISPVKAMRFE
ncbi:FtsX-like permease family protein [Lacinutrix sp. MedPE-SW]|uniref:ABC transporter permease n=1 Tax=Lacinutrix sp. MedPE-SW TaxID=1860087 RepID=UPI00090EE5E6|nr:FtsX-like permease family protein [Lacinutrix sp. MedPE-SW]OIQ17354.1 MAG: transmembrane permease [Lacinutrix sp. MedPE-SW]